MTGRTRRASTSSIETIDGKRDFWRQEASLLKSVPKGTLDDEWPIYELRDAVVLNKDGETLESALDVGTKGPFIIRGTLILDEPEQRRNLLIKVRGDSVPFEIRQCIRYSIGMSEPEGQPIIWVAGKCGFFELNPAPAYRSIYHKMCEATMLYYYMMDAHKLEVPKKVKKKRDFVTALAPIFHRYATLIGDGSTLLEVVERCREHAPFLIPQIMQEAVGEIEEDGEEPFVWQKTLFYKWLTTENSDHVKKAEERLKNPPQLPRSPSVESNPQQVSSILPSRTRAGGSTSSASRSLPSETETVSSSRQRASRSQSTQQRVPKVEEPKVKEPSPATPVAIPSPTMPVDSAPKSTPPESDEDDPFSTLVEALEWAYKDIAHTRDGLAPMRVFNKIYFAYKFPNYKNGQSGCHRIPVEEVFHYNAEALLRTLDKAKYGSHELYPWLQEAAKREFNPVAITAWPYSLVKRGTRAPATVHKLPAPRSVAVGSSPSSGLDNEPPAHNSVPSGRGLGRGKRPGRLPGVKSSLRLATTSKKRPHSEVEGDSDSEGVQPKKSHYFNDVNGTAEDVGSASSEGSDVDANTEPIKILLRADKVPSTIPHGPDETWVCDQEDCDYVVRGGDEEQCQERIRDHFEEHESQMQRVNLALTESRGHLPINHLLDKIKQLGEKTQQHGQISVDGVLLPKPIKRKLII